MPCGTFKPVRSRATSGLALDLYLVELKETGVPIGMCGLLKRDTLPDVDMGFAFLPDYWSRGYAFEAVAAVMEHGREAFGLRRIVAITSLDNDASIELLEKLGLKFEGLITPSEAIGRSEVVWDRQSEVLNARLPRSIADPVVKSHLFRDRLGRQVVYETSRGSLTLQYAKSAEIREITQRLHSENEQFGTMVT